MIIDRWETDYGMVNVKIDWKVVNKLSDKIEKSKEIRRQKWIHILTNEITYPAVHDLLVRLSEYGISVTDFAKDIADGYDLISDTIKSVIRECHENLYVTTENKSVNRSIDVLIENTEFHVGQKKK